VSRFVLAMSLALVVSLAGFIDLPAQEQKAPPVLPLALVKVMVRASKDEPVFISTPFTCTPDVAEFLATYNELYLDGIETLMPNVAKALAKQKPGGSLCLQKMTVLSDEAAAELAAYQGQTLILRGLKTLSTKAAKSLAECKAKSIAIPGVAVLSKEAADALNARGGVLLSSSLEVEP